LKFTDARPVPSAPSPTPVPKKYKGPTYFESAMKNGTVSAIDLKELEPQQQTLYVGTRSKLRPMLFAFNPLKKQVCPSGYQCIGGAKSSIWICDDFATGEHACLPAGDIDVGIDVDLPEDSLLMEGLNVNYNGGYGAYETHILFQCNQTVGRNVVFEPVVENWPPGTVFVARAHTGIVCPTKYLRSRPTGGAIFMFIFIIFVMILFSGGLLFSFIKNDKVQIPMADFWYDLVDSVVSFIVFCFTCGKKINGFNGAGYDSI